MGKFVPKEDGLSETTVINILLRMAVSHFSRLFFVFGCDWTAIANKALMHLREEHGILAGGYGGRARGDFVDILKVFESYTNF